MKRKILVFLLFAFIPAQVFAEDFYISQAAQGGETGADCANSYAESWFNTDGNWVNPKEGGKVGPGDTVHLCGTITTLLRVRASGSNGDKITIYFEEDAKISLPFCANTSGCLRIPAKDYITVDGGTNGIIEANDNGTLLGNQEIDGSGIHANDCDYLEVKNLTISNIYVHTAVTDKNASQPTPTSIFATDSSNLSIHDNVIHDALWSIWLGGGAVGDIEVYDNEIYNVGHHIAAGIARDDTVSDGLSIHDNHFYDTTNWDTDTNKYHEAGIHIYGYNAASQVNSNSYWTNIEIYNNLFDGDWGGCCITGHIFLEGHLKIVDVYNNVSIQDPGITMTPVFGINGNPFQVYNNTIIGNDTANGNGVKFFVGLDASGDFDNNFISGFDILIWDQTGPVVTLDYNAYENGGSNSFKFDADTYAFTSGGFTSWKGDSGEGVNSFITSDAGTTSLGVPESGSDLINTGDDKSVLFDTDFIGTSRPKGIAWDIGAYEFVGSGVLSSFSSWWIILK